MQAQVLLAHAQLLSIGAFAISRECFERGHVVLQSRRPRQRVRGRSSQHDGHRDEAKDGWLCDAHDCAFIYAARATVDAVCKRRVRTIGLLAPVLTTPLTFHFSSSLSHSQGKWDAGMASPDHTPQGRGYDTSLMCVKLSRAHFSVQSLSKPNPPPLPLSFSLSYFHHANDYWTSIDDTYCPMGNGKNTSIVDLWATTAPAYGQNNSWDCSQTNQPATCKYEDELFVEEVLARIAAHDVTTPFFMFWAPHIAHAPLEVPQAYVDKFAFINDKPRQYYAAMVNYVDGLVGRVTDALKAKGMWDNLLVRSRLATVPPERPRRPLLTPPAPYRATSTVGLLGR